MLLLLGTEPPIKHCLLYSKALQCITCFSTHISTSTFKVQLFKTNAVWIFVSWCLILLHAHWHLGNLRGILRHCFKSTSFYSGISDKNRTWCYRRAYNILVVQHTYAFGSSKSRSCSLVLCQSGLVLFLCTGTAPSFEFLTHSMWIVMLEKLTREALLGLSNFIPRMQDFSLQYSLWNFVWIGLHSFEEDSPHYHGMKQWTNCSQSKGSKHLPERSWSMVTAHVSLHSVKGCPVISTVLLRAKLSEFSPRVLRGKETWHVGK